MVFKHLLIRAICFSVFPCVMILASIYYGHLIKSTFSNISLHWASNENRKCKIANLKTYVVIYRVKRNSLSHISGFFTIFFLTLQMNSVEMIFNQLNELTTSDTTSYYPDRTLKGCNIFQQRNVIEQLQLNDNRFLCKEDLFHHSFRNIKLVRPSGWKWN